jgi:PTS system galactitol-specific IIC component
MAIFPRVAAIFAQAFTHLSAASRKFAVDKGREEIYVGVRRCFRLRRIGHPHHRYRPDPDHAVDRRDLPAIVFCLWLTWLQSPSAIQSFIAFSNGNIFKSIISSAIWFAGGIFIATATSPNFSEVYNSVAANATPARWITSFIIMNKPFMGGFTMFTMNKGWLAVAVPVCYLCCHDLWYMKNKVKVTEWPRETGRIGC